MRSALYFPDTKVTSVDLLKSALLMWDELQYLVPWSDFPISYANAEFADAIALIGKPHVPTADEQKQAHNIIEDLVTRPLPPSFLYQSVGNGEPLYEMYPQKFMNETWKLLRDAELAGKTLPNADNPVSQSTGLSLMAILADCCAGETRRRVTDQITAYAGLTSAFTNHADTLASGASLERLVPITLKTVDLDDIGLRRLIEFRKREASQGGHSIRDLRHRYVEKLEEFVSGGVSSSVSDKAERERQFAQNMRDDLAEMRDELRLNAREAILSKEMLVAVVAAVGAGVSLVAPQTATFPGAITASGAPAAVGGLIAVGNKFMGARRSLLKRHPMSYLYELKGGLRL